MTRQERIRELTLLLSQLTPHNSRQERRTGLMIQLARLRKEEADHQSGLRSKLARPRKGNRLKKPVAKSQDDSTLRPCN